MDYAEKLKDPRWQKKRLQIFERDGWTCKSCLSKDKTLNVHHLFYFKNTEPWDIHNGFLITLCEDCHSSGRDPNEEITHSESITRDIGLLLDTLWKKGFDTFDIMTIALAIYESKREKFGILSKAKLELEYKNG